MILLKYKVTNFRSIKDSGWINCDDVTTLVGINEAGKSNLLLALWKLNPAFGGKIDILHDMPVDQLAELREKTEKTSFIQAEFQVSEETTNNIGSEVGCNMSSVSTITVSRYYNGSYEIDFNGVTPATTLTENVKEENEDGLEIDKEVPLEYDHNDLIDSIVKHMPKFVYYSNYGNLSTRIYLPNVVKWLNGESVPGIDVNEDQVRTLRVLFNFVNLQPNEILELGKDYAAEKKKNGYNPTEKEIEKADKSKEERSILLQSASSKLTKNFKEWWNQGEYKFRFEADGDYFRIWVSDSNRPAEVSLEQRSTGLQWFLSFYLIFLVESQENHKNAILLLDEAGLTLHPLAQKDLAKFFNNLSNTNQIINTTHSPFIVDTNNIDRCKVVYMDKNGTTVASDNLRQGNDCLNEKSIYAVHAALGLSVSDILLQGCKPIIVEGPSDQIYLNAIKQVLISKNKISPKEEIVFVPAGGVKGISGVVSILGGKDGELPYVIVDSDQSGKNLINKLNSGLYKGSNAKIIEIDNVTTIQNAEIEDIIPYKHLEKGINYLFHELEEDEFERDSTLSIIPQIESFASSHSVILPDGWKVELAKKAKRSILTKETSDSDLEKCVSLFSSFV